MESSQLLSKWVFYYFNFLIAVLIFLNDCFANFRFVDLGVRRFFLDPGVTLQYYVKFAREYPYRYWADLKPINYLFGSNPQGDPASYIIGDRYFNLPSQYFRIDGPRANATAGTISDSISQAGVMGFLITSFLVFIFFFLLAKIGHGKNFRMIFVMSALCVVVLTEGTLHTSMLSRGLILIPIIMILLPQSRSRMISG